ncbi:hypothetical protein [Teredinibacter sp. KSP-S5-2]|uniref:hypothetical protein n=1 Tax=Teredinibacter sp. KSP-S5-2 TaxID=3034506 RepID=UPI0029341087|nr:hypothetical protein [Teredinibacter sp. KSP-S5-2]WNO08668.1 hypothetical protein P5V12_16985 [Teredinibacter sp. KSP-S5-2]
MNKLLLASLFIGLVGCNVTTQTKDEDVSIENANQHIAMAATVAYFYCENQRWPTDVDELEKYSDAKSLPLLANLDFSYIRNEQSVFKITDVVYLRIPENIVEPGDIAVSSTSKPPKCEGNNVTTDFHMNLGG